MLGGLTLPPSVAPTRWAALFFCALVLSGIAGCGGDSVERVRLSVTLTVSQPIGPIAEVQTWVRPAASAEFGIVRYAVLPDDDFAKGVLVRSAGMASVPAGGLLVRVVANNANGDELAMAERVITATKDVNLSFELPENDAGVWDAATEEDAAP